MGSAGGSCEGDSLTFRLGDPDRRLAGVRLSAHVVGVPWDSAGFHYDDADGAWRLRVEHPALWRLEYQYELHHHDGRVEHVCDPDNPHRVGGAFGDKSVLYCPEYREPTWLRAPGAEGGCRELTIQSPAVRSGIWARIWSPAVPTERILLAHDGPEYERLAGLTHYSAAMVAAGQVAPHHLVLLSPGDRNEWYSASPAYARAVAADVIPRLYAELGTLRPVVGMGASLGALAMLHVQRRYPAAFAGLFLQSGSFFRPDYDRHEKSFGRYLRLVRFVGRVVRTTGVPAAVPTVLACGMAEENLHNNREMARVLTTQGYGAQLVEFPDAHNYTGWRDTFDPYLTGLLRRVWGPGDRSWG